MSILYVSLKTVISSCITENLSLNL